MNAHPEKQPEIDGIDISKHAQQRYLERVGFDPYPADRIRDLLANAELRSDHERVTNAAALVADEAIIVADKSLETVTTVLRPGGT